MTVARYLSGLVWCLLGGLVLVGAPSVYAQQTEKEQAEDGTFKGRQVAAVMSYRGAAWLERPSRLDEENPELMLAQLPIEPGHTVVDMGCGSGYYARLMAERVGAAGRVLCVDIQPQMLEIARKKAAEAGLSNIEYILSTPTDPKLEAKSVDLILLVDVYHEFAEPAPMLEAMRQALKDTGIVALAEYRLEGETAAWIKIDHRMSIEQVEREWIPAGFELVSRFDELPSQHLFLFRNKR